MWYEILPSLGIIGAAMALPPFASYLLNRVVIGNGYRRSLLTVEERMGYIRDRRVTGNPYKLNNLDNLPQGK